MSTVPVTVPVHSKQTSAVVQTIIHPIARNVGFIQDNGDNTGLFTGDNSVFLMVNQQAPAIDRIVSTLRSVSNDTDTISGEYTSASGSYLRQ